MTVPSKIPSRGLFRKKIQVQNCSVNNSKYRTVPSKNSNYKKVPSKILSAVLFRQKFQVEDCSVKNFKYGTVP